MKNYLIGLFIILIASMLYLMISGKSSLFTLLELKKDLKEKKELLKKLDKDSADLQDKINKIKLNDLEYIDELARDEHDMSKPDEIIIFNNK